MFIESLFSQINIETTVSVSSLTVNWCPYSNAELDLKDEIRLACGEFVELEDLREKLGVERCGCNGERAAIMADLVACAEEQVAKRAPRLSLYLERAERMASEPFCSISYEL